MIMEKRLRGDHYTCCEILYLYLNVTIIFILFWFAFLKFFGYYIIFASLIAYVLFPFSVIVIYV